MKRQAIAALCVSMLIAAAAALSAHDEYRIIGTIAKVSAKTLDVKQTKDGKVVSMQMDQETLVTRDKKTVNRAELKTGVSVVVDALGDSLKELLVVEVRLVPPPAKK